MFIASQRFGKHVFVTTNNLHGYALHIKSGRADKNESIRQTVVVQGSRTRKENQELIWILRSSFVTEDTRSPVRNGGSLSH
jgi:hypothetical protein